MAKPVHLQGLMACHFRSASAYTLTADLSITLHQVISKKRQGEAAHIGPRRQYQCGLRHERGRMGQSNEPNLIQRESGWRLINASIFGETTIGGLIVCRNSSQIPGEPIVLELGGNDGLRGYPTAKILDNCWLWRLW